MSADAIIQTVCRFYAISREDLVSRRRDARAAEPRLVAMYLCREIARARVADVASLLQRHHTDISHGHRRILGRVQTERRFRHEISELTMLCCLAAAA